MKLANVTRFFLGLGLIFLFIATGAYASPNLIVDGSFESPTVAAGNLTDFAGGQSIGAWQVLGNDVTQLSTTYAETGNGMIAFNAQSGLVSLDLTGMGNTGPTNGVVQSVTTAAGGHYQLSFWVGVAYGSQSFYQLPATVNLSIAGTSVGSYTNSTLSNYGYVTWEQFTTSFIANATSTSIAFYNGTPTTNNFAGLDNVSLVALPEPCGMLWPLLAIALAFSPVKIQARRRC